MRNTELNFKIRNNLRKNPVCGVLWRNTFTGGTNAKTIQSGVRKIHHPFLADADYNIETHTADVLCGCFRSKKNIYMLRSHARLVLVDGRKLLVSFSSEMVHHLT